MISRLKNNFLLKSWKPTNARDCLNCLKSPTADSSKLRQGGQELNSDHCAELFRLFWFEIWSMFEFSSQRWNQDEWSADKVGFSWSMGNWSNLQLIECQVDRIFNRSNFGAWHVAWLDRFLSILIYKIFRILWIPHCWTWAHYLGSRGEPWSLLAELWNRLN